MRFVLTVLTVMALIWLAGLVQFVMRIPQTDIASDESTDAIIVLTGGSLRVQHGFDLFARDKAHTLFISGVGKNTTLEDLVSKFGNDAVRTKLSGGVAEVVLDHRASSTQTNAREAAQFIRERGLSSVRLVTGNYHMPRSLMEFHSVVPSVRIIPDAVVPEPFQNEAWWHNAAARLLVISEYHKYWAAWFRTRVDLG